jgi:hypothetical protein
VKVNAIVLYDFPQLAAADDFVARWHGGENSFGIPKQLFQCCVLMQVMSLDSTSLGIVAPLHFAQAAMQCVFPLVGNQLMSVDSTSLGIVAPFALQRCNC